MKKLILIIFLFNFCSCSYKNYCEKNVNGEIVLTYKHGIKKKYKKYLTFDNKYTTHFKLDEISKKVENRIFTLNDLLSIDSVINKTWKSEDVLTISKDKEWKGNYILKIKPSWPKYRIEHIPLIKINNKIFINATTSDSIKDNNYYLKRKDLESELLKIYERNEVLKILERFDKGRIIEINAGVHPPPGSVV